MVPPDRGQLLGRAVWKARYVVVGRRATPFGTASNGKDCPQNSPGYSHLMQSSRSNSISNKPYKLALSDDLHISIFKHREDVEPSQSWPLSSVIDCQIQMVARRKGAPVLPTLVITLMDKERKRRSSRAGGFMSSHKDAAEQSIWFRTPSEEDSDELHDWARYILSKKGTNGGEDSPISPSTASFSPRVREGPDCFPRPGSGSLNYRVLHHKSSTTTYSTATTATTAAKERPITISSDTPSLRSKRSDVSSPSSNFAMQPSAYAIPGQQYTTVLPSDLPSPVNTTSDFQGLIDSFPTARRSSTMSSLVRGRENSVSSHIQHASIPEMGSPTAMSESILDRAFQLKYIPGSESEVPGEEKLSSLARFDALMRQAEDNRKAREATAKRQQQHLEEQLVARSAFDDDDSSDSDNAQDMDDSDADDNDFAHEAYQGGETPPLISLKAQRALQFISSRPDLKSPTTSPRPSISRNPTSFHANVTPVPTQTPPPMRPHTSNGKARPNVTHRAQSTHIVPSQHGYGFDVARVAEEAKRRPSASAVIPEHYDQTSKRPMSAAPVVGGAATSTRPSRQERASLGLR